LNRIAAIIEAYESNPLVNEPTSTYEKATSEKIYVFNEWQQKRIDIALKQVENGEYLTEEEDEKEMKKWFEEEDEKLSGQ
jgi:predicted transcriptional regulator